MLSSIENIISITSNSIYMLWGNSLCSVFFVALPLTCLFLPNPHHLCIIEFKVSFSGSSTEVSLFSNLTFLSKVLWLVISFFNKNFCRFCFLLWPFRLVLWYKREQVWKRQGGSGRPSHATETCGLSSTVVTPNREQHRRGLSIILIIEYLIIPWKF